jgi:hypothetical protein
VSPAPRRRPGRARTALPPPLPPAAPPSAAAALRWFWYLLALFVPFAGILTGLLLYDRDSREDRRVGRNCLLIGFLVWVLLPVLVLVVLAALLLIGLLTMAADVTQPMD